MLQGFYRPRIFQRHESKQMKLGGDQQTHKDNIIIFFFFSDLSFV